jgi:quinol monooxygenase YgiN
MSNEIWCIYHLSVQPQDFPEFKSFIGPIVEAARHEPGTLTYEYSASADHRSVHILERYRMEGLLPHVEQTFSPFAERFLELSKIEKLFVYGEPTEEIRKKLDGFGAIYLAPFDGFSR